MPPMLLAFLPRSLLKLTPAQDQGLLRDDPRCQVICRLCPPPRQSRVRTLRAEHLLLVLRGQAEPQARGPDPVATGRARHGLDGPGKLPSPEPNPLFLLRGGSLLSFLEASSTRASRVCVTVVTEPSAPPVLGFGRLFANRFPRVTHRLWVETGPAGCWTTPRRRR